MASPLHQGSLEAIVIGGSAGALPVLQPILGAIVPPLRVPLLVVLHLREGRRSLLVDVLSRVTRLPVVEAEDKQVLSPGQVYVAPPGYHLLVEDKHSLALSLDRPEHYSRPSIDVLFESAALVFGASLLGVLLSGASADGAAGLSTITRCGGISIVQAPGSASHRTMPEAALGKFAPTLVLKPPDLENTIAAFATTAPLPYGGPHV
jgi:two-component system chemotaxis response regulator CheB